MDFEDYKMLLKNHCAEKYDEYLNAYLESRDSILLGRANSYSEFLGFLFGCELMIEVYKDKQLSESFVNMINSCGQRKKIK